MTATWKTVRVFISSTFRDMQAERDCLVRFVFPKLREELLKYRIHFVDVDLRWGVTSDQNASEVCREVVDECHPRFLCMLGGRYGWVPNGKSRSITADEIHYGVLDREPAKRSFSFFYFRDDGATAQMTEETPGDFHEPVDSDNATKLAALKKSVTDAGLPVFIYPAKWDATQKRLTGLEVFGNQVHTDLLQSLKNDPDLAARFTSDDTKAPDEFTDEAEQMEAFIEERTERYIIGSREPLLRDLLAFATADSAPNIFVLTGDPGSGKSALLAKFTRDLAAIRPSPFVIPHFIGASTGSTDLRRTLRRLCHELAKAAENTEPLPLDIKELITHFQKLLAEAAGKQRVILVFDALNQFDATDGAQWLNWLPRELPPGVRIVASVMAPAKGEKEHQTLAILRNRNDSHVEELKPLAEADTLEIIEGFLKRYSKKLDSKQVAALKEKSASNLPLYVLTALEELRTLGTYEEITDRIRTLPGDARALFGWILTERLARDPGFRDREGRPCGAALVEKFAACLGVSRHGLSPAELTALLDPGDPLGNVAALLRLLRPYLMRRGELLDFYHGQFHEAAGTAHLDTLEKQRAAHQSVATCLQAFADPHRDGLCHDATPHALSELSHHQTRAEAWQELIATLENIFFLEAKVTNGMAFELVEDFAAAIDASPKEQGEWKRPRLLLEALRRDIHFIARHKNDYPQALFQCLWNSCWWYDCPEAAQHYLWDVEVNLNVLPSWKRPEPRLSALLMSWHMKKERRTPGFFWVRSLRPRKDALDGPLEAVLASDGAELTCVAITHDGVRVAAGGRDGMIRVWDMATGAKLPTCDYSRRMDRDFFLHPPQLVGEGAEILSQILEQIDTASGGVSGQIATRVRESMGRTVESIAFFQDGVRMVSGTWDATLRIWNTSTGEELKCLRGHSRKVTRVAVSPNGDFIASIESGDDEIFIWKPMVPEPICRLKTPNIRVCSICFSPDGRLLAGGYADGTIRIWILERRTVSCILVGNSKPVDAVAFTQDGRIVLSGSVDGNLMFWNLDTPQLPKQIQAPSKCITSIVWSQARQIIVTGSWDRSIRFWDIQTGSERGILLGHSGAVLGMAASLDGHRIASVAERGGVRVWAMRDDAFEGRLRRHTDEITSIATIETGRTIVSSGKDTTIREWSADNGVERTDPIINEAPVERLLVVPDADKFVCLLASGQIVVWDRRKQQRLVTIPKQHTTFRELSVSQDGCYLASGSEDGTVFVWDIANGYEIIRSRKTESCVFCLSFFLSDNNRIAVGWADGGLAVLEIARHSWQEFAPHHRTAGRSLDELLAQDPAALGGGAAIAAVAVSPKGDRIVSGGYDNKVRFWDTRLGIETASGEHASTIFRIAYSQDCSRVAAWSRDGEVRIWDPRSGRCIESFSGLTDLVDAASSRAYRPLRAVQRADETIIQKCDGGGIIAWFERSVYDLHVLEVSRKWTGSDQDTYLYLFKLEGVLDHLHSKP